MKVWCEICEGKGFEIETIYESEDMCEGKIECADCNGKGYTEDLEIERLALAKYSEEHLKELLEHINELQRLSEIGRATELAFEYDGEFTIAKGQFDVFESVQDLLDWSRGWVKND